MPGPRINLVLGGLLVAGAVAAVSGMRDYGWHFGFPSYHVAGPRAGGRPARAGLRLPHPDHRSAGARGGGVVGVVAGVAEGQWSDWDKLDSVLVLIGGFARDRGRGHPALAAVRAVREAETPTVAP